MSHIRKSVGNNVENNARNISAVLDDIGGESVEMLQSMGVQGCEI